jgi:hypothetical protein
MSVFQNLYYFELFHPSSSLYVDRFPSTKTHLSQDKQLPTGKLFPDLKSAQFMTDLFQFLAALSSNSFGFYDFFWFVPVRPKYTADDLFAWINSLYFDTQHIRKLRSKLDSSFSVDIFFKDESSPQEAIDCIPIFLTPEKKAFVTFGMKKIAESVEIEFPYYSAVLLRVGKHGPVLFGEHLEKDEVKRMDDLAEEFKSASKKPDFSGYIEIENSSFQASPALRAVYEEGGFELGKKYRVLYIGKDDLPGRDDRYSRFGAFGKDRKSSAHTVCILISGKPLKHMPEPKDTAECSKGFILPAKVALEEFQVGGKYNPAFPSHVRQLRNCLTLLEL